MFNYIIEARWDKFTEKLIFFRIYFGEKCFNGREESVKMALAWGESHEKFQHCNYVGNYYGLVIKC